jgi:G3E family GTPase
VRIPLVLVTGFLGSGKTTFLEQLVHRHRQRRIVYLVNEFSARDVDAARLLARTPDVVAISGGSIFCRCLVTEFIGQLRSLPDRFATPAAPLQGVVVEASGMANPAVAGQMLCETQLDRLYEMTAVVAIVDPGTFGKLLHTLPNIRAQIEAASLVLLNKTDLYSRAVIEQTAAAIHEIHPGVSIEQTRCGRSEADVFGMQAPVGTHGELAACVDPNYVTFDVPLTGALDLDRLREAVEQLPDDVFRIKGLADVGGRRCRVDYSGTEWNCEEIDGDPPPSLVFVVRGPCDPAVRQLICSLQPKKDDLSAR